MGRPQLARRVVARAVLPLLCALAACGRAAPAPAEPGWVDLARGFRPLPLEELAQRLEARLATPRAGRVVRRDTPGGGEGSAGAGELWFELPLPRAGWRAGEPSGVWRTPLPAGGALLACERTSMVLADGAHELKQGAPKQSRAGRFWIDDAELAMTTASGGEPPDGLVFRMRLDHGREVDGGWRVAQWDLACSGFLVFPDEPETLRARIPPGSQLCFASVSPDPGGRGEELGPTKFRVRLDGRTIHEHEQVYRRPQRAEWQRIDLAALDHGVLGPSAADGMHALTFEIEGPAPAVFGTPLLAPATVGRPGARPWSDPRPDLVLVLCDTFRADNLAAWGGEPERAPHLNRFVERSLHFLDARAAAAWTLPSIATILSGVFPAQHGATDLDRGVAEAVETVAEVLGRAGYRTVALTDSGLFSRHYGQDQGFQWFEEALLADWNLNHTLARARAHMAEDDGRPLFLLVHTYRVHGPARVGPEEDIQPYLDLRAELRERLAERKQAEVPMAKLDVAFEFLEAGLSFYADAVRDLDRKVGSWIEELERAGFFERGQLVLTADHGNSHGEHDQIGHGSDLFDVKLRVPLAIAGRGIAPRAVPGPVSLVDLAPTLASLAGVAPSPAWIGRSLLADAPAGPVYAFDATKRHRQVALYAEGKKLMAPDVAALRAGEPSHAFDLGADPAEDRNLAKDMAWPGELARALAEALEPLTVPSADARLLQLSPEIQQQLKAIGYGE